MTRRQATPQDQAKRAATLANADDDQLEFWAVHDDDARQELNRRRGDRPQQQETDR